MNKAARTVTGFLLVLACLADVALMIGAKDLTIAGQSQSLLTRPDWDIDSPPVRAASSASQPVAWPMNPPKDARPFAAGERSRVSAPASSSPLDAASSPEPSAVMVKRASRHRTTRAHAHAMTQPAQAGAHDLETIEVRSLPRLPQTAGAASSIPPPAAGERPANAATAMLDTTASRVTAAPDPASAPDRTASLRVPADEETSQSEIDALLAAAPASVGDYLTRGSLLMGRGRLKEALADFARATFLDPASSAARGGLAVAEAWSGDEAAAQADLEKAMGLNPKEPLVFDARAILAQKQGRVAEAIAAYGQALEVNPGDEFARKQRSVLEISTGRAEAALADTAELLRTGASPLAARFLRVEIFAARDQLEDALREAEAAVSESPDVREAYMLRGVVLARLGRTEDAQAQFARSLSLHPATVDLGWVRARPRQNAAQGAGLCGMEGPPDISIDLALKDCLSGSTTSSQSAASERDSGPTLEPAPPTGVAPTRERGSMP